MPSADGSDPLGALILPSIFLCGYAPGTTLAAVLEKQDKEAEMHSRQVGAKVQSWLEESDPVTYWVSQWWTND